MPFLTLLYMLPGNHLLRTYRCDGDRFVILHCLCKVLKDLTEEVF